MPIPFLDDDHPFEFPHPETALQEPDGLLCAGANLLPDTILAAYRQGIFPWYNPEEPILWWSPSTRCVLQPSNIHINRSTRKAINKDNFEIRTNTCFEQVVRACAAPRAGATGTWISEEMVEAYCELHRLGHAHSIEYWLDDALRGGLYGLGIGDCFCGESMFSLSSNASKLALIHLCTESTYKLIDCQMETAYFLGMGAELIPRRVFLSQLASLQRGDPA